MGKGGDTSASLRRRAPLHLKGKLRPAFSTKDVAAHSTTSDCWLSIRGKVYDVSEWQEHPGGRVIHSHAGRDATDAFQIWHRGAEAYKMLDQFEIGDLEAAEEPQSSRQALLADFRAMRLAMKSEGMFESSKLYYAWKVVSTFALCVAAATPVLLWGREMSWLMFCASWAAMGLFWQQSGWLAHDFLHSQVFASTKMNEAFGFMIGNVWQGFSVAWWKNKHNYHHAACNEIDQDGQACDPDIDTLPMLAWDERMLHQLDELGPVAKPIMRKVVQYQKYLFFPLLAFAKFLWNQQSMEMCHVSKKTRGMGTFITEVATLGLHFALVAALVIGGFGLSFAALGWFVASNVVAGSLIAFVFVQSHNGMDVHTAADDNLDWVSMQVLTTRNIKSGPWNDWFSGALNMQIEHHLFPTMPRHSLGKARPRVRALCAKHNIPYEECGWRESTGRVLGHLASISTLLK